jgi:hypothetical protein
MNRDSATTSLAVLRIAIGALSWLAPTLAARLFGLDARRNPQTPYLGRLFGIRDVALGAGTLVADGDARQTWLGAGLACDVADAAAAVLGRRDGYLSTPVAVLLFAPALSAVALGVIALREADSPEGPGSPEAPRAE